MQLPHLSSRGLTFRRWTTVAISAASLVTPLLAAAALECTGPLDCVTKLQPAFGQFGGGLSLVSTVSIVIKTFLSLLGIIFIGMILFAGYNWMTAMGEKEKVQRAKDTLISAAIGLVIIIAAYSITVFVINALTLAGGA